MKRIIIYIIKKARIMFYKLLSTSTCKRVEGKPVLNQPMLALGKGKIKFNGKVIIGYFPSPFFFSTNAHIKAKETPKIIKGTKKHGSASIDTNTTIYPCVTIDKNTIIGCKNIVIKCFSINALIKNILVKKLL